MRTGGELLAGFYVQSCNTAHLYQSDTHALLTHPKSPFDNAEKEHHRKYVGMTKTKATKTDRSAQITIRLDPKILVGLHDIAARIGIAPTTVAGMAIGEYVAKTQATFVNQARMTDVMAAEMAKVIGTPFASMFEGKSPEELKALFVDNESPEKQHDWTEGAND